MGNGIPINFFCCNSNNKQSNEGEDIDIKKNSIDYNKDYKTIKMNKADFQNNNLNTKIKKIQTHSAYSSDNDSKNNKGKKGRRESLSHNDPNSISLFNNTFQILNNTQQYISFSNMNFLKNNLINNHIFKNYYNSKFNSSAMNSNSNLEFNMIDIKTKLILSGELFLNQVIEIDKNGMKNSLRQKNDGKIIFGYKQYYNNNNNAESVVDYLLDIKVEKTKNKHLHICQKSKMGKIFEILLNRIEKVYILNFIHNSLLLYYQINDVLILELDRDYFLILGDIFLIINVKRSLNQNEKIINLKVEIENEKPQKYSYEQKDAPIKIGRANCHINIPKPSISKIHSVINFSNDNFYYKDKKSTNGSTLLLKEDDFLKIKGEMHFKLEDIPFQVKEIIDDE